MTMETSRIPRKLNKGAFAGKLTCPRLLPGTLIVCGGTSWKYVENVTPTRIRYRCKKCNRTVQYDFSNNPFFMKEVYGKNTESVVNKVKSRFKNLFMR